MMAHLLYQAMYLPVQADNCENLVLTSDIIFQTYDIDCMHFILPNISAWNATSSFL